MTSFPAFHAAFQKAISGTPGAVRFDPEPSVFRGWFALLESGQAFRITLCFRERFREEPEERRDLGFVLSRDEWMPTWWTLMPLRARIITGWAAARRPRDT